MKVVILCGGQGTRLRQETEFRPKPLVEIGGRPVLWHIMRLYAHHGFNEFILCLGYRGNMIKEYFLNYQAFNHDFTLDYSQKQQFSMLGSPTDTGSSAQITFHPGQTARNRRIAFDAFKVTLVDTGEKNMTGSRVKQILPYLQDDDTFMLTYGDGVANVNIRELAAFHKCHDKLATVTSVQPDSRFGVMDVQDDGHVSKFIEKPKTQQWSSAGYFVLDRGVFDLLDDDPNCVFEERPLQQLAAGGQLVSYAHHGFFYPMDTFRDYLKLNELWEDAPAPWEVWHGQETLFNRGAGPLRVAQSEPYTGAYMGA
ncbi:MAG: glucose-1-phosphate cytidylyltransferase [Vampirovibrionales bacterium]|nr:glucose-1-phosphate cytidylyltransferase [Vampirovibrionales bacterium]